MLNEFNHDSSGYIENQDKYIRIAEAGYEAIKSVNPDAKINGGSLAGASRYWTNDESGSEISKELMNWCDSFSWHFYSQTSPPENEYFARAKTLKEFLNRLNSETEMWITECGWLTRVSNDALDEDMNKQIAHSHDSATELEQARWYTRAAALFSDDAMADKFFFYNLIDAETDHFDIQANFGIVHAKSYRTPFAAKPAYVASAAFNDLTGCKELAEHSYENGVYAYEFKNGTTCLWADEGQTKEYTFEKHPDSTYIAVFDMYGNPTYYETGSVKLTVTQEPIYVRSTSEKDAPVLKEYGYDGSYVPYSTTRPTPVPAPEWVGEDGTFWSEDFSGAAVYDWENTNLNALKTTGSGKYDNIFEVSITPAKGYGRTLAQNTGVDSGFYLYNKDIGGLSEHEDIDMQTLVLAQDVYIPSGEYTGGRAYTETWSTERISEERTSTGAAHIFEISPGSDSAKLVFQTKPAAIDAIEETGKNTVSLKYDEWHRIETAVNFAAGTVEYYVDGQKAAIYRGTPSDIRLFFPMAYFGLRSDKKNAGENPLKLFWDNFNMRVTDEEFVPSKTSAAADEEYDVKNTLIDMDFDGVTADQLTSDDLRLVHQKSETDFSFSGDPNNAFNYTNLADDGNGGKLIEYEHYLTPYPRNGLKFPFRDPDTGAPVTADSGLLIVEFDAGIKGDTGHSRVLIGLNDPNKTDSDWTPATLLSGIMPYDGEKLSVTAAASYERNNFSSDSGMESTMAFTKQGELHHYKYVIDIDRGTYKMYYDDILLGEFDRLAGDAQNNSFDALMITGVNAGDSTEGEAYIMIDNIVVKNAARADGYDTNTIYLGTFDDDENAKTKTGIASGYVTMISDAAAGQAIDSIEWRFKMPNGRIKELTPPAETKTGITLNGGAAEITVIVDGLEEENTECIAVVIN